MARLLTGLGALLLFGAAVWITWIGIAIIAYMLLFTYLGYTASATK